MTAFTCCTRRLVIVPLVLGGWLGIICYSRPAAAQRPITTPIPDDIRQSSDPVPFGESPLPPPPPPLSPEQSAPLDFDFRAPAPDDFGRDFERFLVYVDSSNPIVLQQVRRVEPGAYIRQYRGNFVIQAGVFSRQSNAQLRRRKLESLGINGVRLVSFSSGEEPPDTPDNPNEETGSRGNFYYVAIPSSSRELPALAARIRRLNRNSNVEVKPRYSPRGPHVAVGPFKARAEAEEWNGYLRSLGIGDPRVYYGR
jgi:hypothetical protein